MQRRTEIALAARMRTEEARREMFDLDNTETWEKAQSAVGWFLDLAKVGLDEPDVTHLTACVAKLLTAERQEIALGVEEQGVRWSDMNAHQPATAAHTCTLIASEIRSRG